MGVSEAGQLVILVLSPTLLMGGALVVPRAGRAVRTARRRARERHAEVYPQPAGPPIEQLGADLRRLLQRYEAVRSSTDVAMRARHLQAIEAAIGDCATDAARALGVAGGVAGGEWPRHGTLTTAELRRLLRGLADAGLVLVPATGLLAADS